MLRNVQQHPEGAQADDQARAPVRQERQRDPLRRRQTQRHGHVQHRLHDQPDRNPHPEVITTAVRGAGRRHDAAPKQYAERDDHRRGPDEPQLFGDHREHEIGVRLGQEKQLLTALPDALAVQSAAGHRQDRLAHLEAGPQRVVVRVHEGQDAAHAVRRLQDQETDRQGAGAAAEHEVAPAQSGEKQKHDRQEGVDRRRTEVGLQVHQEGELPDHDGAGDDRADDIVDPRLLARHEIRQEQDERQLADLGRLDLHRPQDDPAMDLVRTVGGQLARHHDLGRRRRTRRRKSSPRSSKPVYWSNEAQAGARRTTLPSSATCRAASTASDMLTTFVVGTIVPSCAAITSRAFPMSTRCATRSRMSGMSRGKSPPLSLPPKMSTTLPGKLSSDLIVALTFVALESLYQVTPPTWSTFSSRCGRPRKPARARSARGRGTPHRSVTSRAVMTFSTLCAPNSGIEAREIARMSRPSLRTTIRSSLKQAPSSTVVARLNGWTCALRVFARPQTSSSSRFRMAWSALPWFLKMRVLA